MDSTEVDRAREFGGAVVVYCDRMRASVTSWYRTPSRNLAKGGVPDSLHLRGLGADVVLDAPVPLAERQALAASLGLKLIPEFDHDHLQAL